MSSVLPQTIIEQIEFCEAHVLVWTAAPAASVGLTAPQVALLDNLTKEARDCYTQAQEARASSKAATTKQGAAMVDMRAKVGELVAQIKSFANLQANPAAVFAAAQIPMPSSPSPAPVPGVPTNIQVGLESSGAVTLSWEATNSAASGGAFFQVYRKLPGQSGFTSLGGAPGSTAESRRPSFTDATVPTTAAGVGAQYIIQGMRGTSLGPASPAVIVQFGVDGGANFSFAPSSGVQLAA
ncbi:MAG: hypothetical protein Q8L55_10705 [Phycisphaerales bacterium]|nr:hypothetical protein [Phycisphaerales bacterium]